MEKAPQNEIRSEQLGVMLTYAEKAAVAEVARDLGMTLSNAGRYLIRRSLAAYKPHIIQPDEGE